MHEMGTVMYVIRAVNEVCEENKLTKVASVTLEIGEVSGIIPSYIKDFWQWAIKKEKYLQDAELIIEPIKAVTRCGDCGKTYDTIKYAKICPPLRQRKYMARNRQRVYHQGDIRILNHAENACR